MKRLTDDELKAAKKGLAEAKASLACEGMYLTPEQEAMFRRFEDERLPHEERRRQIVARYRRPAAAAE